MLWKFLYNLLFIPVSLGYLFYLAFSPRRRLLSQVLQDIKARTGLFPQTLKDRLSGGPVLWIHAASVGEVWAVEGLLSRIKKERPELKILMTTSTQAGKSRASNLERLDAVSLVPLDFAPFAWSAVSSISPRVLVLVETEIWPNLILYAKNQGAKVLVVNGHISNKSFVRYQWIRPLLSKAMGQIDCLCVQEPSDVEKFKTLGASSEKISVSGNLKYDFTGPAEPSAELKELLQSLEWDASPIFTAGSTHPIEEEIILEAYAKAREKIPSLKLILAPRHVERAPEVKSLLKKTGIAFASFSQAENRPKKPDCLLMDKMGMLADCYRLSSAVFVGGSLVPVQGHNILEPAICSVPVLFGPYLESVRKEAELLIQNGGAFKAQNAREIEEALAKILGSPETARKMGESSRRAAESLRGALEKTWQALSEYLS